MSLLGIVAVVVAWLAFNVAVVAAFYISAKRRGRLVMGAVSR